MSLQKLIRLLLKVLVPITQWVGRQHIPYSIKRIDGADYASITKLILPGDVLCVTTRGMLTNLLIPGKYKHAAMYVGGGVVVEALGHGVVTTDLLTFCLKKDFIKIRRPLFCDAATAEQASFWASSLIGKPYDYLFEYDLGENEAFYCSEVIWWAYEKALPGGSPFTPRVTLGVGTVTPDDIAKADKKWQTIWIK